MSREWTVHAQLTISEPIVDGDGKDSATGGAGSFPFGQSGSSISKDNADGEKKNEKPITIVYQWTAAADDDVLNQSSSRSQPKHGRQESGSQPGYLVQKTNVQTVRGELESLLPRN